ncbi:MAG TPA: 3-hydroxybutyryl-CoA dehydrogenase [Dehalococcoidales bacterium]|nr:3-hydroxybutyryl-CoA dehydrogenase [Dehalococcoidales bacterium]
MEIKKVGVVGCGSMGAGIAQLCAQSGYQVVASEINDELLKRGMGFIEKTLARSVEKGKLSQADKDAITGRLKGTTSTKDFADCDLVIEAAIENLDLKKKIFAELDGICPKDAILATNTSCLSIIDMAIVTKRPGRVVGLHFFNPAPIMKLLEIVKTIATSDETMAASKAFGEKLGKTTVVAKDAPGFIVNRLWIPFLLHSIRLYEEGVASREDIDNAIQLGLNYPMGPLTLSDMVGIDIVKFVSDALYEQLKDPRYIVPTLVDKMVAAGWLGRKTGKGFYDYSK